MARAAVPHPHHLVLGYYSVYRTEEALEVGEPSIAEIERKMKRAGAFEQSGAVAICR
jgi:hypothetical protein